jgi:hypothetical protein
LLRRLAGEHMELSDDSNDGSTSSDNNPLVGDAYIEGQSSTDDDDPLAADAYTEGESSTTDRKGKGVARK